MPSGIEVYGPDGTLWLAVTENTTRLNQSLIFTGPASGTVDFNSPPNTTPWVISGGNSGVTVVSSVARIDANTARVTYNIMASAYVGNTYPVSKKIVIHYGNG